MILITGAAGFIGFHTALALLEKGESVAGVDNMNDYYDPSLKEARLSILKKNANFSFYEADISDHNKMEEIANKCSPLTHIIHLAAQAGVRHSLDHPYEYEKSNLQGQLVMLEIARHAKELEHFVYASSSSVYGGNTKQPFSVDDRADKPVSLYAATKRAGELMVQSYSHLYAIPCTGLRFFTVYGPYGRPDMAYFSFTKNIIEGKPITVFNNGDMKRDFTWIDDIVAGVIGAFDHPPKPNDEFCFTDAPHRIFNLGNNKTQGLLEFIEEIENALNKKTEKIMAPMAPGDVAETYADISAPKKIFGYDPKTSISEGIPKFIEWYLNYYDIEKAA